MVIAFLIISAFLTSIVSGTIGMGGGLILLGLMTLVMPLQILVPIHGIVQLSSNGFRALFLLRDIHRKILAYYICGTPIGGYLGYWLLKRVERPEWLLVVLVVMLLYATFKSKKTPGIEIPMVGFFVLGITSACLGCLIGATGPLLAPFFIRDDLTKESIVASKASCQVITHLTKIPVFLALDFAYAEHWGLMLAMVVATFLGTKIGTSILRRLDREKFIAIFRIVMIAIACRLLYKFAMIWI